MDLEAIINLYNILLTYYSNKIISKNPDPEASPPLSKEADLLLSIG